MTLFQCPLIPRILGKFDNTRMELMVIAGRERKKRIRYLGSGLKHFNDRLQQYGSRGGIKGTRFVVDRQHTRTQYFHPKRFHDLYSVRAVRIGGAQYDQMGNTTRVPWDQTLCTTSVFQDPSLHRNLRCMSREDAITFVEEWGLPYVLLDEIRKPSLVDAKYHRHQIYANKFSWSPDPDTNAHMGDADWKWKGLEQINYDGCGAHTRHERNDFKRSMWTRSTAAPSTKAAIS